MKSDSKNTLKTWYVADGWIPSKEKNEDSSYEGHEAVMILNCRNEDTTVLMDIIFEDKDPIIGISLKVPAMRVRCFRMDKPEEIGGVEIKRLYQYGLKFSCEKDVIVQFGRMDVTQPNLAYMGYMAYSD